MTRQDFIIQTLLPYFEDPTQCSNDRERCMYRSKDGKTCAVGKHIKPKSYKPEMEDMCLDGILPYLTRSAKAQKLTENQWLKIQGVHDQWALFTQKINSVRHSKLMVVRYIRKCEEECEVNLSPLIEILNKYDN